MERFNAIEIQSNSEWGVKDDLVLFTYGSGVDKSHMACISANMPNAYEIYECNKEAGICGNRIVNKSNPQIRGYVHNSGFEGLCSISNF